MTAPAEAESRTSPMWGLVQPAVLLILSEGPQHGYALLEALQERGYLPGKADVGNLYRGLRRLEKSGAVTSEWVRQSGPGPSRRTYQITDQGRQLLYQDALALADRAGVIAKLLNEYRRLYPSGPGER